MSTPNPPVLDSEPTVNVILHMQQGTGNNGAGAPPDPNQTMNWVRAKGDDGNGNWTVDSQWWFYYSGGNGQNAGRGGTAGGEVDMPTGGCFSIGPSGNEVITSVVIHESGTGSNYTPNPPTANASGVYVITDAPHTDPAGTTDSFDVYAKFSNASDIVKCDPIIRNK